jgi:hypothetical protein
MSIDPTCIVLNLLLFATMAADACLAAAFRAVNPDAHPPCPAMDGFMIHSCLVNPSVTQILVVADSEMNLTTCPEGLADVPFVINRSVTIMSDPRGPRMKFGKYCQLQLSVPREYLPGPPLERAVPHSSFPGLHRDYAARDSFAANGLMNCTAQSAVPSGAEALS